MPGSPGGNRPVKMFLTPSEAATFVGLSVRTLSRYRSTGKGPVYYKFRRAIRYTLEELIQWAATRPPGRGAVCAELLLDEVSPEPRPGRR